VVAPTAARLRPEAEPVQRLARLEVARPEEAVAAPLSQAVGPAVTLAGVYGAERQADSRRWKASAAVRRQGARALPKAVEPAQA
jgi:hypothetical protein